MAGLSFRTLGEGDTCIFGQIVAVPPETPVPIGHDAQAQNTSAHFGLPVVFRLWKVYLYVSGRGSQHCCIFSGPVVVLEFLPEWLI
jgi:hypothetical protein